MKGKSDGEGKGDEKRKKRGCDPQLRGRMVNASHINIV